MVEPPGDPIVQRRARLARIALTGQRIGYGLLGVAIVAFAVCIAMSFPSAAVTTVIAALAAACVVLPPAIILGFAVRAAEREDREHGR